MSSIKLPDRRAVSNARSERPQGGDKWTRDQRWENRYFLQMSLMDDPYGSCVLL